MENNVTVNVYTQNESYFDGGLLSYIGHSLLAALITICTFLWYMRSLGNLHHD